MRSLSLLLLRVSIGWLLVVWGADKLANPSHGIAVARSFYYGWFGEAGLMSVYGIAEIAIGLLTVIGLWRRYVYPVVLAINAVSLVGVWKSVVDPWGWYLGGTNALFYPSLIIFASVLVLMTCRDLDKRALDRR